MKIFIFLIAILPFQLNGQSKYVGYWHDYFATGLKINSDSTFKYTWRFDMQGSWMKGVWKVYKDTIYFNWIPVYDTLKYFDSTRNIKIDSLILSLDENPELITKKLPDLLYSGNQNYHPTPEKLYYHDNRLYLIDEKGKLIKGRVKYIWATKKNPQWFVRRDDWLKNHPDWIY